MKTAPIIYTDEDVRPDLLTAKERSRFPQTLTNDDRKQILELTRLRMDSKDYNGYPILSPEEWSKAYDAYLDTDMEEMPPELQDTITREVVLPMTGEVKEVDAGLQLVVQRLMDRGVVIDTAACRSGMVTDHPGMRWMHDETNGFIPYKPGSHMMHEGKETLMPVLTFPTDNTLKYYNNEKVLEVIREAARVSGLVYTDTALHDGKEKVNAKVSLPYLMDGTGHDEYLKESSDLARQQGMPEKYQDRVYHFQHAKEQVAAMHGGVAVYSDTMIQDRFSRFERYIQRNMANDNTLSRFAGKEWNYEDFLTGEQTEALHLDVTEKRNELWKNYGLPHIYSNYNEPRERVDEVARMAGYKDYIEYVNPNTSTDGKKKNQQWMDFQKLKEQHLTVNQEGRNKIFRISNGVGRQAKDYVNNLYSKYAMPVINHYRRCGYPVDKLGNVTILYDEQNKTARAFAVVNGKYEVKPIDSDVFLRLKLNSSTPFETALITFAKELQWKGRPNIAVSEQTAARLGLQHIETIGDMPLTQGDQVFKVNADTWQNALQLTRFEQMSPWLQQKVLQRVPPVDSADKISIRDLQTRMDAVTAHIDRMMGDVKLLDVNQDNYVFNCKIDGEQQFRVNVSTEKCRPQYPVLPGDNAALLGKLMLAEYYADKLFPDRNMSTGFKR